MDPRLNPGPEGIREELDKTKIRSDNEEIEEIDSATDAL